MAQFATPLWRPACLPSSRHRRLVLGAICQAGAQTKQGYQRHEPEPTSELPNCHNFSEAGG